MNGTYIAPRGAVVALNNLPPMPAVQRILLRYARNDRESLEALLSVAIDLLDLMDGDPDLEDGADREAHDGDDQGDISWSEWHQRGWRDLLKAGPEVATTCSIGDYEDDEDDDAGEDDDLAGGNVEDEAQLDEVAPHAGLIG